MTGTAGSAIDLVDTIRRESPAALPLELDFDGCRIRVLAGAEELVRDLSDYFAPFTAADPARPPHITVTVHEAAPPLREADLTVKPPDPGKHRIKEEFIDFPDGRLVRKRLTGMVFLFTDTEHVAVGPCRANLNQVVNFVNNRFIQWKLCRGALLGHAAGVAADGRGLALAGFSGAGKSTLALELMREEGWVFVSNDRLMIRPAGEGLEMAGVAKLPRINPGTALHNPDLASVLPPADRKRFQALSAADLWDLEHKYDVSIDRCFGPGRFRLHAPMEALVLLNWRRTDAPLRTRRVDLSERRDLLPAFMKETGLFFRRNASCRMPEPAEAAYVEMLGRCRVWEFTGGADFAAAGNACRGILAGAGAP